MTRRGKAALPRQTRPGARSAAVARVSFLGCARGRTTVDRRCRCRRRRRRRRADSSSPNSDATLDFASTCLPRDSSRHRPTAVMPYRAELKRPDLKGTVAFCLFNEAPPSRACLLLLFTRTTTTMTFVFFQGSFRVPSAARSSVTPRRSVATECRRISSRTHVLNAIRKYRVSACCVSSLCLARALSCRLRGAS